MVRHASFQMSRLRCISAAKSRDHCMYHGSSLAACSGGNITFSSEGTLWSTPVVSVRVRAVGDKVVAAQELLADFHPAFECSEAFVEPIRFHAMFNPLKRVVFFVDVGGDCPSHHFEFSAARVVAAVVFHFGKGCGVLEATCRFSQGVVGSSPSLEEFKEPVGEGGSGSH